MGLLDFLRSGSASQVAQAEPNLQPEALEQFRRLSTRDQKRLLRQAHESATRQVNEYGRLYQENYDAYLELELGGHFKRMAEVVKEQLQQPYVSPAAADAFMFGQTGDAAFLPTGWRGPKDERDVSLASTDEEYWAAMYPTGLLDRDIAEAYMLGVASRKQSPAK